MLFRSVRHLSIAARRKAGRYQSSETEQQSLATLAAPNPTQAGADALAAALASLAEEHREVLLLRFVDGLSLAEIAAALDIPLGTVKSRMHNSLKTLRNDPRTKSYFEP